MILQSLGLQSSVDISSLICMLWVHSRTNFGGLSSQIGGLNKPVEI